MILFKKSAKPKVNYIFVAKMRFCARNAIKNETKYVNKRSLFCSNFVIFLIFLVWWSPVFKPDFYIFWTTQEKLKKFDRQLFNVSHLLKVRSWISQFLKPDNIRTCNILEHLKIFNFRTPPSFTWIIIALFFFFFFFLIQLICLRNDKFFALTK